MEMEEIIDISDDSASEASSPSNLTLDVELEVIEVFSILVKMAEVIPTDTNSSQRS